MPSKEIHATQGIITTREKLEDFIEEECLEACLILYDKNIRTIASNSNNNYAMQRPERGYFIMIDYDSLDENNKRIAEELRKNKIIDIKKRWNECGGFKNVIMISGGCKRGKNNDPRLVDFNMEGFKKKCEIVAEAFSQQDVLFGHYTPEEVLEQIIIIKGIKTLEEAIEFLKENNLIRIENDNYSPNIEGILEYIKTLKDCYRIPDPDFAYITINVPRVYDKETNEFWVNEELLQKHKKSIGEAVLS